MPPVPAERAVERGGEHYNHPYQQQQRAAAAADYTQALQPITSSQSTKILKELVSVTLAMPHPKSRQDR